MRVVVCSVATTAFVLACWWSRDTVAGTPNVIAPAAGAPVVDALKLTKRPSKVPATLHGVTVLHWDISDRGVGYFGNATTSMRTELMSDKGGTVTLRAIGQTIKRAGFLTHDGPAPVPPGSEPKPWKFDERWTGHWGSRPGTAWVLRFSRTDQGRERSRDFACRTVSVLSGTAELNYIRCDLMQEDTDPNWGGDFEDYMHVPLIFSANNDVQASIVGGREPTSVTVYPLPAAAAKASFVPAGKA